MWRRDPRCEIDQGQTSRHRPGRSRQTRAPECSQPAARMTRIEAGFLHGLELAAEMAELARVPEWQPPISRLHSIDSVQGLSISSGPESSSISYPITLYQLLSCYGKLFWQARPAQFVWLADLSGFFRSSNQTNKTNKTDVPGKLADFFSSLLSDPLPGRSYRDIRIERQADSGCAFPSKDACANNSDLIQHHQRHGHQEHGKEGCIGRDNGRQDQRGHARVFPILR